MGNRSPVSSMNNGAAMQSTHALEAALGAGDKCYADLLIKRKLQVSAIHLYPFYLAYMHRRWCCKIDAKCQWHGPPPYVEIPYF